MNEMVQPMLTAVKLDGMEMTVVGFKPGGPVSKSGILAHLISLNYYQHGINWCVGDLLNIGEEAFGEDWVLQAIQDHMAGMSTEMHQQCRRIAERFPFDQRITELFWTHHQAVAGIKDEEQRTLMLETCLVPTEDAPGRSPDKPMTVTDLRRAVRAAKLAANGVEDDLGMKALETAKRAIERLEYPERVKLTEWLTAKADEWARIESGEYGHGEDPEGGEE